MGEPEFLLFCWQKCYEAGLVWANKGSCGFSRRWLSERGSQGRRLHCLQQLPQRPPLQPLVFVKHSLDSPTGCHADKPLPKSGLEGDLTCFALKPCVSLARGPRPRCCQGARPWRGLRLAACCSGLALQQTCQSWRKGRKGWGHPDGRKSQHVFREKKQ